ncbi:hypothetical protein NY992_02455, partial [Escherichia coli]|nr:hypothetical protein [Escherichia coli]
QIREILINESAWEEMTCLFAPSKNVWYNKNIINKIECCSVDNLQSLLSIIAAKMKSMIYQK